MISTDSPPSSRRRRDDIRTPVDGAYDAATKVAPLPPELLESLKSTPADVAAALDEHDAPTVLLTTEPALQPEEIIEVIVDPIDAVEQEIALLPRTWKIAWALVAAGVLIAFAVAVVRLITS